MNTLVYLFVLSFQCNYKQNIKISSVHFSCILSQRHLEERRTKVFAHPHYADV